MCAFFAQAQRVNNIGDSTRFAKSVVIAQGAHAGYFAQSDAGGKITWMVNPVDTSVLATKAYVQNSKIVYQSKFLLDSSYLHRSNDTVVIVDPGSTHYVNIISVSFRYLYTGAPYVFVSGDTTMYVSFRSQPYLYKATASMLLGSSNTSQLGLQNSAIVLRPDIYTLPLIFTPGGKYSGGGAGISGLVVTVEYTLEQI